MSVTVPDEDAKIASELIEYCYVLVTPARNEEAFIEKTIQSVISQTVLPKRWVVVSDGSTDGTDAIVKRYAEKHAWIEFVRLADVRDRSFAAKAKCFNAGYQRLQGLSYDIIGNLDADLSFENDYFEFLLAKFKLLPDLGVAGTPFLEEGYSSATDSYEGENHVAGGCQLFRRACFEEIGGYVPVKGGGIDWIAVTTARMKGWKTRSFKERHFFHYRGLGTAEKHRLRASFDYGMKDYFLGGHPIWQMLRVAYRMMKKPYVLGGTALLAGYCWALLTRTPRPVSPELMRFHRREQMQKLSHIVRSLLAMKKLEKYESSESKYVQTPKKEERA